MTGPNEPERLEGQRVSAPYLRVLGIRPAIGRDFTDAEDVFRGANVVILSDKLWRRRFAADPGIVGKTVMLNGHGFTVVGVAARGFRGINTLGGPDLWVPLAMHGQILTGFNAENYEDRRALLFNAFARLKPGVTIEQADAAVKTIAKRLEQQYPTPNRGRNIGTPG